MALLASLPSVNLSNLEKIESFLNDSAYREALESSSNYNTRLCLERRLRMPFLDSQTGVAQNHSQLFMSKRQRIPGLLPGQIYSYPRARWRKKRRQYLTLHSRSFARTADAMLDGDNDLHSISQVENPALQDTDSKDSQLLKDEVSKDWFYDEQDMLEMEGYDEPDADSDFDYEESYSKRKKTRKNAAKTRGVDSPSTPRRGKGAGRGRKKATHNYDPIPGETDKPFGCELCGARYKTRPGLTYHYGHSHRDGASDDNSRDSVGPVVAPPSAASAVGSVGMGVGMLPPGVGLGPGVGLNPGPGLVPSPEQLAANAQGHVYQDSYVTFLNHPAGTPRRGRQAANSTPPAPPIVPSPQLSQQQPPSLPPNPPPPVQLPPDDPPMPVLLPEKKIKLPDTPPEPHAMPPTKDKAAPSPYCDFCLGDARENKKSGTPEELVSCSDCGRSGHPSCLQFTANMIVSVHKYRWQCIECKCCSVCGNSDNDDQLLFCDDCDRGYHMYCLSPPLTTPPEGSWSCKLCIAEFHKFEKHWFPEVPAKGQGYRCIRVNGLSPIDMTLEQAALQCGLSYRDLRLPTELTVWVDPSEVCYRLGESEGSYCTLATFPSESSSPSPVSVSPTPSEKKKLIRSPRNNNPYMQQSQQQQQHLRSPPFSIHHTPTPAALRMRQVGFNMTPNRPYPGWRCDRQYPLPPAPYHHHHPYSAQRYIQRNYKNILTV